ncbi:hypothetical protein PO909_022928, partial [Leuciscus waleckii]
SNVEDETAGVQAVCEIHAVLRYEYHVLYSCSYQIPVLYFRASTLDGNPLSLEEVWSNVHPNYRQRLQQGPWDTLTQQEHPLLGQPFFMLHPCRTEEFMKPALDLAQAENKRVNYIVTWLSVVGPVVGLDVPLTYCTEALIFQSVSDSTDPEDTCDPAEGLKEGSKVLLAMLGHSRHQVFKSILELVNVMY